MILKGDFCVIAYIRNPHVLQYTPVAHIAHSLNSLL